MTQLQLKKLQKMLKNLLEIYRASVPSIPFIQTNKLTNKHQKPINPTKTPDYKSVSKQTRPGDYFTNNQSHLNKQRSI